jgi:hypothetical protein
MDFIDVIKIQEWFDIQSARMEAQRKDDDLNNPKQ